VTDIQADNNVVVPESHIQLTDHQPQELHSRMDPLSDDGNNGISHFLNTVTIIQGLNEIYHPLKYFDISCDGNGSS